MSRFNIASLPELDKRTAVIGGSSLSPSAQEMAFLIGYELVAQGNHVLTGGRKGAGESASLGAYEACRKIGSDPENVIFSFVPEGKQPDFRIGSYIHIGKDKLERRIALIQNTYGAIVIGGGKGTASEVRLAVLEAIMNGYSLIPVSGTGGEADRICSSIPPFEDAVLNDPFPSQEKARIIVKRKGGWYCDMNPSQEHDKWFFSNSRDYLAEEMYKIRHKYF